MGFLPPFSDFGWGGPAALARVSRSRAAPSAGWGPKAGPRPAAAPRSCRVIGLVRTPAQGGWAGRHSGRWEWGRGRSLSAPRHEDPRVRGGARGARRLAPLRPGRVSRATGTVAAEGRGRRGRTAGTARSGRLEVSAPGFCAFRGALSPPPPRPRPRGRAPATSADVALNERADPSARAPSAAAPSSPDSGLQPILDR